MLGELRRQGVDVLPPARKEEFLQRPMDAVAVNASGGSLDALFAGTASLFDAVSNHMAAPFPLVGSGENIATVRAALHDSDAVMVIDDGKPVGVLTRADLLAFLAD